jgi:hypothetical protein
MLVNLEHHFTNRGWYSDIHPFIFIRLEGGFEAFSGKASETWEYRWIINIPEDEDLGIPAVLVKGNVHETLDSLAERTLEKFIIEEEKQKNKPQEIKEILVGDFVDWNQYNLDELCEYLDEKYRYNSSGEALAIFKLI